MIKNHSYIVSGGNKSVKVVKDDGSLEHLFSTTCETVKYSTKSLLRYPGGKTRAVNIILSLIPKFIDEMCAPFIGGGSVELACTGRGIKVFGYDIFKPLVEFWQSLIDDPHELANHVLKYYPLSKEKFYHLQKVQKSFKTKIERAVVFYVLNRSSYSGSTLSGGMSPGHPRFTLTSIDRIRNFHNPLIKVRNFDFRYSIERHPNMFLYLDPPYLIKNNLYGRNGDAHRDFDHLALFKILDNRDNWLLSYNNCPEILDLYKNYKILFPVWKYGMSNDKNSREVLILSKDIQAYFNL